MDDWLTLFGLALAGGLLAYVSFTWLMLLLCPLVSWLSWSDLEVMMPFHIFANIVLAVVCNLSFWDTIEERLQLPLALHMMIDLKDST